MDEPVETDAQLRQHRVHVFAIHGLPHVLHLPADVHAYFGAGLVGEGVGAVNIGKNYEYHHATGKAGH